MKIKLLQSLFFLLLLPVSSFAQDYFVNSTGTDSLTCGTFAAPCKSIKQAILNKDDGVAVIKIAAGMYVEDEVEIRPSSQEIHNDVTLEGGWNSDFSANSGDRRQTYIHTGNRSDLWKIMWHGYSSKEGKPLSLTVRCLTIENASPGDITKGIYVTANSDGHSNFTLDNVRITGFKEHYNGVTSAVYATSNGDAQLSVNIKASTFDSNSTVATIYFSSLDNSNADVSIKKCRFLNNASSLTLHHGVSILSQGSSALTSKIENTLFVSNLYKINNTGIHLYAEDTSHQKVQIVNTTITGNKCSSDQGCGVRAEGHDTSEVSLFMANTILHGNYSVNGTASDLLVHRIDSATVSFVGKNNIIGVPISIGSPDYTTSNCIFGDPKLDSRYHLLAGSPAIDSGLCGYYPNDMFPVYHRVAPFDDIDGDKRPGLFMLSGCDIGADEYYRFPWPMFLPAIYGGAESQ
jgi:hypothetical protein